MKTYLICLVVSLAVGRCADQPVTEPTAEALIIRSGTSYGFCLGYCLQTLELSANKAVLTKSSNQESAQYPTKTCNATLTDTEWNSLRTQVDLARLQKQPVTLGCPDCADGGAEFLEIQQGDKRYRVTFEAGKTIPGFEALVTTLRQKRKTFENCQ